MAVIHEISPTEVAEGGFAELAVVRGGIVVKPHVQKFFDALEKELGWELSLGTYVGHSPPEGPTQAVDFFNSVSEGGFAIQDRACAFFQANVSKYGGRYCIRRHHIWNIERADEGWRDQGVTGNQTADHMDHSHFTFYADAPINHEGPDKPPAKNKESSDMFLYSTAANVDEGSYWFVVAGVAHRMHKTEDVEALIDQGVVDFGERSVAFHGVFEHRG